MTNDRRSERSSRDGEEYADWPVDADGETEYVGTTSEGIPVYHGEGRVFEGDPDLERKTITPIPDSERRIQPGQAVSDVIEEIGETLGWDRLASDDDGDDGR